MGIGTSPSNRWIGVVTGLLAWMWLWVDPVFPIFLPGASSASHPLFSAGRLAGAVSMLFLQILLGGLFDRHESRAPRLALAGYVLASMTTGVLAGVLFYQAMPGFTNLAGSPSSLAYGLTLAWGIFFALGYVLSGLAAIRLGPRMQLPALLTMLGAPFLALSATRQIMPQAVVVLAGTLWALGHAWMWMVHTARPKPA